MSKNLPDYINTLTSASEFEFKEKGSLFHTISIPISSEEEAQDFLAKTRKRYYDATHHCYSFKLHVGFLKYSDDGEPNGTAGIRILNAQNHYELTDLLTIVIRYFGGTKLGVGPLGKAYYESALGSFHQDKIVKKALYRHIVIEYDFSMSQTVHHFISKYDFIIRRNLYDAAPSIHGVILSSQADKFTDELRAISSGRINCGPEEKYEYLPQRIK